MWWALGFIFLFTIGGVTGVVLANASWIVPYPIPIMWSPTSTTCCLSPPYSPSSVAGIRFPKMTGYMYSETLAKLHFWLTSMGRQHCLLPHALFGSGWDATPIRRLPGFLCRLEFSRPPSALTFRSPACSCFLWASLTPPPTWGAGATTLEWTLPSPPPFHTYETLPRIT